MNNQKRLRSEEFIIKLKKTLSKGLPGEEAHIPLLPVNRPLSSIALENTSDYRQSAVSILIFEEEQKMKSLLIERQEYKGVHSKQIAFPGGKMEDSDPGLEFTARRECYEEISLPIEMGTTIGELTKIFIPVSKFLVQPYLIYLENDLPELIPDQHEVATIIKFDLSKLIQPDIIQLTDIRFDNGFVRRNIPFFNINGYVVWGATAMILAEMRAILDSMRLED